MWLGLNSTLIVFGDSLRAYGLGCLFIVLVVFCGAYFLRQPNWSRAALLAAAGILSVQTLYHNAILVGAVCLGAMIVCSRRKNRTAVIQVFLAGAAAAVSLLPYASNLLAGREGSATLRTGLKLSRLLEGFSDSFGFPMPQYTWIWGILAVGLLVQGWLALRTVPVAREESAGEKVKNDLVLFAAATFVLSFAGFYVFLWLAAFPSQSWYLLPLLAVAVACVDFVWPFWHGKLRFALVGFVIATTVLAVPVSRRILNYRFTNVDVWTRQMKAAVAPDDYVIVVPWFCGITFGHYFQNPAAWDTLPPLADHATHRFDLVKMQLQDTNAINPVLEKISATLASGHQVWVLSMKGWMDVPEPGTTAAATLPPAPFTRWGWSEVPYTRVWVSQVAHRLDDQGTQFGRVNYPAANGLFVEDTELFLARGWRGVTNPVPAK